MSMHHPLNPQNRSPSTPQLTHYEVQWAGCSLSPLVLEPLHFMHKCDPGPKQERLRTGQLLHVFVCTQVLGSDKLKWLSSDMLQPG